MRFSSLRTGTSCTCDRLAPGTLSRKRWWTANWRDGKTGAGDSDERKDLLPCPLLEPAIRAKKRAQRRPQEAPATKAAVGVIQSGWWTQEIAHKAGMSDFPFCLNCGPGVLGSAQPRLWACPAYRETRMNLPPNHQHQGQTATGDKLKWERGLLHDPAEKYTPGRTHDGTIHVWTHPSVVGNSFGGKLFVDGSLMCKYGSQGGQAGWAVTQIHETSHELVCSAHGAMPISLSQCSAASCGHSCGLCGRPSSCRNLEQR